jgi:hypothetical protein
VGFPFRPGQILDAISLVPQNPVKHTAPNVLPGSIAGVRHLQHAVG